MCHAHKNTCSTLLMENIHIQHTSYSANYMLNSYSKYTVVYSMRLKSRYVLYCYQILKEIYKVILHTPQSILPIWLFLRKSRHVFTRKFLSVYKGNQRILLIWLFMVKGSYIFTENFLPSNKRMISSQRGYPIYCMFTYVGWN